MKAAEDQLTSKAGTKATPGMQHSIAGGCPARGTGSWAAAPWSHGPGAGTRGAHSRSPTRVCPRRQRRCASRSPGDAPPGAHFPSLSVLPCAPRPRRRRRARDSRGPLRLSPLPAPEALRRVSDCRKSLHNPCPRRCRLSGPHTPRRGREAGGEMLPGSARRGLRVVPAACAFTVVFKKAKNGLKCESAAALCRSTAVGARKPGQKLWRSHYGVLHTPQPPWTFVSNT